MRRLVPILGVLTLLGVAAFAQDPAPAITETADDNGFIIDFLQNTISGPGRQIRLEGVTGALSSQARIAGLTVADDEGVWLSLEGIEIDWSRLSLLRGRVNINRLAADRIELIRRPTPPETTVADRLPAVEAQPFSLPELPVSVQVQSLELPEIVIDEAALGQAATLGATGSADLARGELEASLDVRRLDGPGGELGLALDFSNSSRELALDLRLQEPQGGVVATLLDIEDRPAIDLRVQGAGPLDALDVELAFDAGGARIAGGEVVLRGGEEGLAFTADLSGGFAPVVPAPYRDFFAGQTSLALAGVSLAEGGVRLDRLDVSGAALELTGALRTAPDGFPSNLTLSGSLGDPRGPAITLPVPGAATSIHSAVLYLSYGAGRRWNGLVTLDRLAAANVEIEDLTLRLGGSAENLSDPAERSLTMSVDGVATGVFSEDPDIAAALGERIDLFVDAALPAGAPLDLRQAQLSGNGVSIFAAGSLDGLNFDGRIAAKLADLAPVSGLAGRELGGGLDLRLVGAVSPLDGIFDLELDGTAQDLRLGDPRLDNLLAGATTLDGRVARDTTGFRTDAFRLANPQLELTSTGRLTQAGATDFDIDARLNDLAALDPRLAGTLTARGRASGDGRPIDVTFQAEVAEGRLMDRDLTGAALSFDGQLDGTDVTGALRGGAQLGDQPITLAGDIALEGPDRALRNLEATVGPNRLTGEVSQSAGGLLLGEIDLDAPDVTPIAALALTEASGAVRAQIGLQAAELGQGVSVEATVRDLEVAGAAVGALDLEAQIVDALGAPLVQGDLTARDVRAGGIDVETLTATAEQTDATTMQVTSRARLAIGTEAEFGGALTRLPGGFSARLDRLSLRQEGVAASLASPATVTVAEGAVTLTPLTLDLGEGRLTAQGEIAERFDLEIDIRDLPLALANTVQPALGLAGSISGTGRITGPRAAPDATFDMRGDGIAAAATRSAGLPPLRMTASGRTAQERLQLDAALTADGLEARAAGSLPMSADAGDLQLDVDLAAFPLSIIDQLAGNQGLRGEITGQAQVSGSLSAPAAAFTLNGSGVSARALSLAGVDPLTVSVSGAFENNALTLQAAEASNGQGLNASAAGRVPLSGPGLDVRASGSAPLSLADVFLADRTAQATGTVQFDVSATGSIAAPQLGGSISLDGGTFVDPETNLRLQEISLDAGLEGQQITLRSFRAGVRAGGAITGAGTISLAPGNPADVTVAFDRVRYTDGSFVSTTLDGELRLLGPATGGGGVLSGEINLGRTEISVAEGLGANAQQALNEVEHVNTSPDVQETLRRAKVGAPTPPEPSGRGALETNIRINAPNQIFVRGRGLDVELGGSLQVTGPTTDVAPVGQFDLRRGRLEILGQRITFTEGSLRLEGNLDPVINFVARTTAGDVTAIVTVTGRVSSPEVAFSAEPALPQDEVLAQLLFNRSVGDLSAFQIAQLAVAAAELAGGGGGPGILSQLRDATGFDDLDVITDETGETAVSAGKYIDDNIYLDVQTDSTGDTRAQINLDVNDNLTVRGSVASDGNSTLGLFFERDY